MSAETIWKLVLKYPTNHVMLPVGAKVLHVANQHDEVCAWVQVDPLKTSEERVFMLVPTGGQIPQDRPLEYRGTAHLMQGGHVLHMFEGVDREH